MNFDRLLCFTFAFSILSHGALLLQSPHLNPLVPAPKEQTIKVRYLKKDELRSDLKPKPLDKADSAKKISKSEPFLKLDSKIGKPSAGKIPPPYIEREKAFKGSKALPNKSPELAKPAFSSSEALAIKKKISLPKIEMARINNPSYISYYQIVREKIRRSAYQNYTHNEIGEVYLSFIISNDGYVRDIRLIEAKTRANDYLKKIALRSVRDASPFPNFPKELDYPQLSFNIVISFEVE
jgi:TonB family protein